MSHETPDKLTVLQQTNPAWTAAADPRLHCSYLLKEGRLNPPPADRVRARA